MSAQKWVRVRDQLPLSNHLVLGYDIYYGRYIICKYNSEADGNSYVDDRGRPLLREVDEGGNPMPSGDYSIGYWMALPEPPNVADADPVGPPMAARQATGHAAKGDDGQNG